MRFSSSKQGFNSPMGHLKRRCRFCWKNYLIFVQMSAGSIPVSVIQVRITGSSPVGASISRICSPLVKLESRWPFVLIV